MTFLLRPLDSARQGIRALRARCSLRVVLPRALAYSALPFCAQRCLYLVFLAIVTIFLLSLALTFPSAHPRFSFWLSLDLQFVHFSGFLFCFGFFASRARSFALVFSFFCTFIVFYALFPLPSSWCTEWLSTPQLGPVNQTVILWADRLRLPLLC